jgi:hypothetical protein
VIPRAAGTPANNAARRAFIFHSPFREDPFVEDWTAVTATSDASVTAERKAGAGRRDVHRSGRRGLTRQYRGQLNTSPVVQAFESMVLSGTSHH